MSDPGTTTADPERDAGMTLIEVLLSAAISALITAVLATSIIVVLREASASTGRFNVARAEQVLSLWMPADLASAEYVDTNPASTPCGQTTCGGVNLADGSNVLMLSWDTEGSSGSLTRQVSYNFAPTPEGTYDLRRVWCSKPATGAWTCRTTVVLHDLPKPPAGKTFVPGVANGANCTRSVDPIDCTKPDWVIIVSQPLAADATSEAQLAQTDAERKNASRVVVTVNGGGRTEGAGGGINQISITAGGAVRQEIDAKSLLGAPSFAEIRSRCGGALTVLVDESNSIGTTNITQVKAGITAFIRALAGTPVKLQVIGFHTYSHVLGDPSAWHHYFDMTQDADVTTLLTAVNDLKGSWTSSPNGGTNWEEALFRTFYEQDGSTASVIPKSVVFFTDGVPTYDRLVHRTSPGVLPATPPAAGAPWATSSGSSYSQVAFDRARFIADNYRTTVRLVGVGVGADISKSSGWVVDPGAGYRTVWERGSYSYVRDTWDYQLRYQKKNTSNAPYFWVNFATYSTTAGNRRRDLNWTSVTQAEYLAVENPVNTNANDGARVVVTSSTPVSSAEYQSHSTDPLYHSVTKTYAAGPDWELWPGSRSSGNASEYRSTRVYNSPPYEAYDPAMTLSTANSVILSRLISGNDNGTPALYSGSSYTNADIADLYVLPQWSQFTAAMQAVALGQCGGTLTLQTKNGSSPVPDPFRYQNTAATDSAGTALTIEPRVVTTNQQFTSGVFDFLIGNGQFLTVDVVPQNYSELGAYLPVGWSCKSGTLSHSFTPIALAGTTTWTGIRVRVAANEAVSCLLTVRRA